MRWKKCVGAADSSMGDLIGRYYVQAAFGGSSKQTAMQMIKLIKQAFADRLPQLDWMDDETVKAAKTKLGQFYRSDWFPRQMAVL